MIPYKIYALRSDIPSTLHEIQAAANCEAAVSHKLKPRNV